MLARAYTQEKTDWLGALRELIRPTDGKYEAIAEFETVDALLAACAGDLVAGVMLKRVLAWYQSKDGGEFYMSESAWYRQCYVSRHVIKRVQRKNFPLCGVSHTVKPAQRGREAVTHYRLNVVAFVKRLSEVVGVSVFKLMGRLPVMRRYVPSQSVGTLTIDTPINKQEEVVNVLSLPVKDVNQISLLTAAGLSEKQAKRFEALPIETIQACIDSLNQASARNPKAYLVGSLKKYLGPAIPEKLRYPDNHVPVPEVAVEVKDEAVQVDDRAMFSWNAAMGQLACQLPRDIFEMNLKGAKLVEYREGEYVVQVGNEYARDLCQHRFYRNVQVVLSGIVGGEVSVKFIAREQRALSELLQMRG